MPSKKTVYECKYCRKEFTDYDECEEQVDNARIAKELRLLGEIASGYHIGGMVMGMALKNYENLMEEAANRLEKRE